MAIEVVRTIDEVRSISREARKIGKSVALVPTMGGLHDGHLSLVAKAEEIADLVIVSIFVNPTQFNNPNDLETYPGNEADDLDALKATSAAVVFAPNAVEMYPQGYATKVSVNTADNILCDAHRPGHFEGVATVVSKLFIQVEPDFACFGEKDFQQLFIIRRMAIDLNMPVKIVPVQTVREKDGLALSSRNARLGNEERKHAPALNAAMKSAAVKISNGVQPNTACLEAKNTLETGGIFRVEYLDYRSGETLETLDRFQTGGRLFAAAWLGDVRLIDNIPVQLSDIASGVM